MIKYQVRSRDLIDMVTDIRSKRLILSPYFQRNLVWRDLHKRDFIETIMKGYPFPQIFVARGEINVETMTSQSCIVDGQQRMNAIIEYIDNTLSVNGRHFKDMDQEEKESFLKYQIPVIDLEMKATDPSIIDIFKRLNRTFYSLSSIEKMSTEYSSVDFMLLAKYMCGFFEEDRSEEEYEENTELQKDPNIPIDFLPWAKSIDVTSFTDIVTCGKIFSGYENARMVHLMWTLNLLSTIRKGFFPRNDKTKYLLDAAEISVPNREHLLVVSQRAADLFKKVNLPENPWWGKSNAFSFMVFTCWNIDAMERMGAQKIKYKLEEFGRQLPEDYALAAREAVNNLRQRRIRHDHIAQTLGLAKEEMPRE